MHRKWITSLESPRRFVTDILGATPEPWQAKALDLIGKHNRVVIRSGHGVGKTALLAWITLWFLLTRYPSTILKQAPYGILYNVFSGNILTDAYAPHLEGDIYIVADQRNKESHDKLTFNAHIKTKLITDCQHAGVIQIDHKESHDVLGLQAVDFVSWGLFRDYEHGDPSFKQIITPKVCHRYEWYM